MNNCSLNSHGPHDLNTVPDEKNTEISIQVDKSADTPLH